MLRKTLLQLQLFGKRRLALPLEHLEVQGWNVFSAGTGNDRYRSPLHSKFRSLSASSLRSLAGNAMHVRVVGTVAAFALAYTEPCPPVPPNAFGD